MFQIGEFSRLVRISPRMLRHYEKCGLIYPAEVDRITGYRQYSAAQIPLLLNIAALRDMGFSIDEIGDILPHLNDAARMEQVLNRKSAEIHASIEEAGEKLRRLERMRNNLTKEKTDMDYEVILKELPAVPVLSLRETITEYSMEGMLWHKMGKYLASHAISCPETEESGYSMYHDEQHRETDVDVEIAVPVEKSGEDASGFVYRTLDAIPLAATLRFAGPYEGYAETTRRLAEWIEANGYEMSGMLRGVAIRTPADQSDPQNYLTELQIPVRRL